MKSYACYVHLPGAETPHLRFVRSEGWVQAVDDLIRQWPDFELINLWDGADRLLASYTQSDWRRLIAREPVLEPTL